MAQQKGKGKVTFIRKGGRVVPIRSGGSKLRSNMKAFRGAGEKRIKSGQRKSLAGMAGVAGGTIWAGTRAARGMSAIPGLAVAGLGMLGVIIGGLQQKTGGLMVDAVSKKRKYTYGKRSSGIIKRFRGRQGIERKDLI